MTNMEKYFVNDLDLDRKINIYERVGINSITNRPCFCDRDIECPNCSFGFINADEIYTLMSFFDWGREPSGNETALDLTDEEKAFVKAMPEGYVYKENPNEAALYLADSAGGVEKRVPLNLKFDSLITGGSIDLSEEICGGENFDD